jgi:signal transduction histidine kinase
VRGRSIRWRITALATVITAVVLTVAAVVVVIAVRRQLLDNLDRSLAQRADQVEVTLRLDPAAALANTDQEDRFAQVLDERGSVVFATDNLAGSPAVVDLPSDGREASTHSDIPIDDDAYRVLVRRVDVDGSGGFVVVGQNVDDARDATGSLVAGLATTIPVAVGVLGATTWWLVGRTLRPVEHLRREVADIGLDDLSRRVPAPGTGDEIDRLASTMNDMLARLERSADQQRRFVSDASHELRTPLTRMRAALEVELAARHGDRDLDRACHEALDGAVAMQHLLDDLLFLARQDAGHTAARPAAVDLDVVVDDEVRRQRAGTDVRIVTSGVSAAAVSGSAPQLERVVRNLLSNAVHHARHRVDVTLGERDTTVELVVDDDGPGIAETDRRRVFERFVRLDEARSTTGGSGLGLAIARDVVEAHGGAITVGESPSGGARFVVTLPART